MKHNMYTCNVICVWKKTILSSYKGSKLTTAFQELLDFGVMLNSCMKTSVLCFTVVKKTKINNSCQKKGLMRTGKGKRRAKNKKIWKTPVQATVELVETSI